MNGYWPSGMTNQEAAQRSLQAQTVGIPSQQNTNYGEIGVQAAAVTLTGQISGAHALLDHLGEMVAGLEKRLSPILSSNYPDGEKNGNAISCEPPAIEEMDRLLNRLRSVIEYVDSIERRTRI